ncbi:MAG TPA: tripartite tricarboxylate transporter substrate binding protein [Burkholderiaceae bacterium]|nr:tripartite tricarboxylate transporter substrate binding protein [Burkholderiaceae bacterium]
MKTKLKSLLGAGLLLASTVVHAAWPERAITLVVPFPPGGSTDVVGRLVSKELSEHLGVSVVVENRSGAAGNIGSRHVANARPDGYTLLLGTSAQSISAALYKAPGYDFINDLDAIATVNDGPLLLVTRPDWKVKNVRELVEYAKQNPGKVTYASAGHGTSAHMAGEVFSLLNGIDMLHVPYQGASPAMTDLMSGQVDMAFDLMVSARQYVEDDMVNFVGMATRERSDLVPDWETISEQYPEVLGNMHETAWNVVMAPKGTPDDVIQKLSAALKEILNKQEVRERFATLGNVTFWLDVEETREFIKNDVEKWKRVVEDAKIQKL